MKCFWSITTVCYDDFSTVAKIEAPSTSVQGSFHARKISIIEIRSLFPQLLDRPTNNTGNALAIHVTPGEVWILIKYRSIFTLRESLGGRISFVVQDSQYIYTTSPWTPRICNLRNFRNIEVNIGLGKRADGH
jgi:hypothetical protein